MVFKKYLLKIEKTRKWFCQLLDMVGIGEEISLKTFMGKVLEKVHYKVKN
jgi:hypothetical protein